MYPVSGGTGRFPHFAFGSVAGISFGFFSWLQAVDGGADRVLRGRCSYASYWLASPDPLVRPSTGN